MPDIEKALAIVDHMIGTKVNMKYYIIFSIFYSNMTL